MNRSQQPPYHKLVAEHRALRLRCQEQQREIVRLTGLITKATERVQEATKKLKAIPCPKD